MGIMEEKKNILKHFKLDGEAVSVKPHGSGHINRTFLVETDGAQKYILQKINTDIFRDTDGLMENIVNVTSYLKEKIIEAGGDPKRETMTVIPTTDGKYYYVDGEGNHWRVYLMIEHVVSLDQAQNAEKFYASGLAFGRFQAQLADYPAETLHETIPDFHNTPKRYEAFEKAVMEDICHRAQSVAAEVAFIRERREEISVLADLLQKGELPLRITHNDTKLNNILLDADTHEAVCIVDLDTIMPGLCAYDFGDAIRFGANTAVEDEPDVSKVSLSLELYAAYAHGFLKGCGGRLTAKEIETLPLGAKTITTEQGIRFLTDYLQGDTYYHTEREGQNLDRCRTQLALVADMERKWEKMRL
ncbi:MAG: aminoglycoside phosphotransferase family protein [Eubacterium sp.]|nr:aminoglycoside phosphotransferase family protein [Eubacterium sp.]